MAGNILTPSAVWKDFRIDEQLTFETVEEEKRGDLALTRIYLNGRTVKDGTVKIYGVLVRNVNVLSSPAILCVQDFRNGADEEFAVKLAEKGYAAFTIDVAGEYKDRKHHTVYPPSQHTTLSALIFRFICSPQLRITATFMLLLYHAFCSLQHNRHISQTIFYDVQVGE